MSAFMLEKKELLLKGVMYTKGFVLHPPSRGQAQVSYRPNKRFRTFEATVGIRDGANGGAGSQSPLTFLVKADDVQLWSSRPLQKCGLTETCSVPVASVEKLTLVVSCPGDNYCAHGAWGDPRLKE